MFHKSVSALFVAFLVMIGILPAGKSKCCDRISFLVWLTISTVVSIGWIYVFKDYIAILTKDLSIDNLFLLSTTFLTPIWQMIGTDLALSTASKRYPWLVRDGRIPLPDYVVLFLVVTLSNLVYLPVFIENPVNKFPGDMFSKGTALTGDILFSGKVYISSIITGICVAQLKSSIQKKEDLTIPSAAIHFGEKVLKEFKSLKWFLSPLMFVLFLVNSLNAIGHGYFILAFPNLTTLLTLRLVASLLTLGYVCLVVDSCFGEFKSVADKLRS